MKLTGEQEEAYTLAENFLDGNGDRVLRIGGYAGTGKTTLAKVIYKRNRDGAACAFTGKAASVLRSKGIPATTIHKLIYKFSKRDDKFILKDDIPYDWIMVDEGSMISNRLWFDLGSFQIPIIVLGDPGQLEPIGDDPGLMVDPDYTLETIHRQAAESPILRLAHEVRDGNQMGAIHEPGLDVYEGDEKFWDDPLWADQILCGRNVTRVKVNKICRELIGYKEDLEAGDRLIVLCNDYELGVWNGQMLRVWDILDEQPDEYNIEAIDDAGDRFELTVAKDYLSSRKSPNFRETRGLRGIAAVAAYGYCTTVHKFQGSEADKVAVLDEQSPLWEASRHRYTAITRAAKELRYYL